MSCGCKNKTSSPQPVQSPQNPQPQGSQATQNPTIQESIKKVVEKYYKK